MRNKNCTKCLLSNTSSLICARGQGPKKSLYMSVEDIYTDDNKYEDFFNLIFNKASIDVTKIYRTNSVLCDSEKKPTKSIINKCSEYIHQRIEKVKPKFIFIFGATALMSVLGLTGIRDRRGRPFEKDGIWYFPTYHPSMILRDNKFKDVILNDMKLFKQVIEYGGIPKNKEVNTVLVDCQSKFKRLLKDLEKNKVISFDIETNGLYAFAPNAKINLIGFGLKGIEYSIPTNSICFEEWVKSIDKKLTKDKILVMANGKFDSVWMEVHFGVQWFVSFDTQLAQYVLDENSLRSLKFLAQKYLDAPDWDIGLDTKKGNASISELVNYHGSDLYYTRKLYFVLKKQLKLRPAQYKLFKDLLIPMSEVYHKAQVRGVKIDMKKFKKVSDDLNNELSNIKKDLDKYKKSINWASPKQVANLLFDELGIEPIEKTASGAPSTSETVLKRINHPVAKKLLEYRNKDQLLKMFINGWKDYLIEGRLHPTFKIDGTVTGRPSCQDPNLQQVPRDPLIRSLIIATKNWVFVEADESQAELRIAAELAGDPTLINLFKQGKDAHWNTAIMEISRGRGLQQLVKDTAKDYLKIKNISYSDAIDVLLEMGGPKAIELRSEWKELRKKAKAVNFGYLFGMWWKKFIDYARDNYGVHITDKQAQESRRGFFNTYSELENWHKRQKNYAIHNGFVESLCGRKRNLPDAQITDKGYNFKRDEALRQAINSPVQGFSSDILLMATIELTQKLSPKKYRCVGTVHDSILQEVHKDHIDEIVPIIIKTMQAPKLFKNFNINLDVPLVAEAEVGPWGSGIEWKGNI